MVDEAMLLDVLMTRLRLRAFRGRGEGEAEVALMWRDDEGLERELTSVVLTVEHGRNHD